MENRRINVRNYPLYTKSIFSFLVFALLGTIQFLNLDKRICHLGFIINIHLYSIKIQGWYLAMILIFPVFMSKPLGLLH